MLIKHIICPSCSVGCGLNLVTDENEALGTYPYKRHPINEGKNCLNGRNSYKLVNENRIYKPLEKKQGKLEESSLDEVLKNVYSNFKNYSPDEIGILTSGSVNNECIESIVNLGNKQKIENIGFYNDNFPNFDEKTANYDDINNSKFILVIGNVLKDNPLIGRRIILAKENGAEIISVDTSPTTTTSLNSDNHIEVDSISEFIDGGGKEVQDKLNEESVIIFNNLDSKDDFNKIVEISKDKNSKILPVLSQCNSFGAMNKLSSLNDEELINLTNNSKLLLLVNLDLYSLDENISKEINLSGIENLISITSHLNDSSDASDIVVPCSCWAETSGSFTNTSGLIQNYDKVLESPEDIFSEEEILNKISENI